MGVVGLKTGVKPWSDKPNLDQITKAIISNRSALLIRKLGDEDIGDKAQ